MNEWNIKKMINASLRVKEKDNMGKMENMYYSTQSTEINIKLTEVVSWMDLLTLILTKMEILGKIQVTTLV